MIVIDTNVVSELMRPDVAPQVLRWVRDSDPQDLHTTAITIAEVRYGIQRLAHGKRKDLLWGVADEIFQELRGRVLPFDMWAAKLYPTVVCDRDRAGRPIHSADAQIAAVCRCRGAVLATRNVKDFEETGVRLINPWEYPA